MTTVLADLHAGVMVADSGARDEDRQYLGVRKVWRHKGALLGFAGSFDEIELFLTWWRAGQFAPPPKFKNSAALVLSEGGLLHFAGNTHSVHVDTGREAIGTGSQAAMAAYEAMGWQNAKRAVQIACRHDVGSRLPVRVYEL